MKLLRPHLATSFLALLALLAISGAPALRGQDEPPAFDPQVDELLAKAVSENRDDRRAALDDLLGREKEHIDAMVVGLLVDAKEAEVTLDLLRALGLRKVEKAVEQAIERLEDRDPTVRSFAAVCLERLERPEARRPLLKRAGRERNVLALKNALRALGVAGQNEGDAAAALVKRFGENDNIVAANAVLAAARFQEEGRVRSRLAARVGSLLSKTSDIRVRSACLYTIGLIGTEKELKELEKLEKSLRGNPSPLAFAALTVADIARDRIEEDRTGEPAPPEYALVFRTASDDARDPARDGDPTLPEPDWMDAARPNGGRPIRR